MLKEIITRLHEGWTLWSIIYQKKKNSKITSLLRDKFQDWNLNHPNVIDLPDKIMF